MKSICRFLLYSMSFLCFVMLSGCSLGEQSAKFLFPAVEPQTLKSLYISETGDEVEVPDLELAGHLEEAVEETDNGYLYPAKKDGLWGYISADGEWKIEPCFLFASLFHENYAQVLLDDYKNAFIDSHGNIQFQWEDKNTIGRFGEGIAIRYQQTNQDTVILDFINTQGEAIVTGIPVDRKSLLTVWDQVEDHTFYIESRHFSEGLLVASLNGKYGYLNTEGKWIIEPKYEDAQPFSEGLAAVCLNGKYGYIDHSGKEVVPCIYERAQSFSEGLGAVKLGNGEEWAWQFIKSDGSVAFQFEHRCFPAEIGPDTLVFHEGLCCAREEKYWVYYDKSGNTAFTIDTWTANSFQHGLAYVQDNQYVSGYIDTHGDWVYQWDTSIVWDELMNKNSE
ncbi:WG repeat-containing protein [Fournierella massiliensis]|uniref:WG repeat-containing protein n=2 Tax=Allofournierella massiliensis TaxID=1650663 RepID=A0ABT7UV10_9FIRM|nr:WG repeat-containing protein [Fournierella massiliensis]